MKILKIITNVLGMEGLMFDTGRHLFRLILVWIVIDFIINKLYLPIIVKQNQFFSILGAIGILSIVLYVCWEILDEIGIEFPKKKEKEVKRND